MEASIPYGHDERPVRHGERAGKMHGIGAPQRMFFGELTGVTTDGRCQLDGASCVPELVPVLFCLREAIPVQVMVPVGGGEGCSDLGIGQPARHGGVASVPQRDREVRSGLLDEELHECTGIEIDERHLSAVAHSPAGQPVGGDGGVVAQRP